MYMMFPLNRFPNTLVVRQIGYILVSYTLSEGAESYLTSREFSLLSDFCSYNYKIPVNVVMSRETLSPIYMLNRIKNLFFSERFSSVTFGDLIVQNGIIQHIRPTNLCRLNYTVSPADFSAATGKSVTDFSYVIPSMDCVLKLESTDVLKEYCNSYDLDYKKLRSAVYKYSTPKLFYTYSLYKGDVLMKLDYSLLTSFTQLKSLAMSTNSFFDVQYQDSVLKLILMPNFSDKSYDYNLEYGDKVSKFGKTYTYRNMPVPHIHSCGNWRSKPCAVGVYRDKVYSKVKDEYISEVLSEFNLDQHDIHTRNYVPEIKYNYGSNRSWKSKKIKKQWQKHKQKPIRKQTKGTHYYFTNSDFFVSNKKASKPSAPPLSEEAVIKQLAEQYSVDYWLNLFNVS